MGLNIFSLTWRSICGRGLSVALIIATLSLSIALYFSVLGIQRLTRDHFANALTGIDLVVAPRGNDMQIILYTFFNIGEPTGLIDWKTVEDLQQMDGVKQTVPISLGDSLGSFRVLGASDQIFSFSGLAGGSGLNLAKGQVFENLFDIVLGSTVASELNLNIGDAVALHHGMAGVARQAHDQLPFTVVGVLKASGTPFDRMVIVPLRAIDAIHMGWRGGRDYLSASEVVAMLDGRAPDPVSAVLIETDNKLKIFSAQREINQYAGEALSAVVPGVALARIWQFIGAAELGFQLISGFVIIVALVALLAMTLTSLEGRRREMAILRSVGASPLRLVSMLLAESLLIAIIASFLGVLLNLIAFSLALPHLSQTTGLTVQALWLKWHDLGFIGYIMLAALIATVWPAAKLYKRTVHDGIAIRN